jgi:hypothetical protein
MNERGKQRFTIFRNYKFDKYIFRYVFLACLILLCATWFSSNGLTLFEERISVSCPAGSIGHVPCENPFYHNEVYRGRVPSELLEMETLPVGYNLNPPPFLVNHFGEFIILIIVIGFLVNHAVHNRGYDFKKNLNEIKKDIDEAEE